VAGSLNAERVMGFVTKALLEEPEPPVGELYERARTLDPGVAGMSLREFNARFPLQIRRREALERPGRRKSMRSKALRQRKAADEDRRRAAVRGVLLRFAVELSEADGPAELVRVMAGLEAWVDETVAAAK